MTKLGLTNDFILKPLTFYLENQQLPHSFQLEHHSPARNVQLLLNGHLDIAVISPLEYARHSSELKILPDFAVVSSRESRVALLFFKENLSTFQNVLYPVPENMYYHLTRIALLEFYEMDIQWTGREQLPAEVEVALQNYDAALYTGNEAIDAFVQFDTHLDMVEEWCDKSAVPFVHFLIVSRQEFKPDPFVDWFARSYESGKRNLLKIAESHAEGRINPAGYYLEILQEMYRYTLGEDDPPALKEMFNFLYYYGVIDFLPELHWW